MTGLDSWLNRVLTLVAQTVRAPASNLSPEDLYWLGRFVGRLTLRQRGSKRYFSRWVLPKLTMFCEECGRTAHYRSGLTGWCRHHRQLAVNHRWAKVVEPRERIKSMWEPFLVAQQVDDLSRRTFHARCGRR